MTAKALAAPIGRLEMRAVVYEQPQDFGDHFELIARGALKTALAGDGWYLTALFNHNPDRVLGRKISGTLSVREDAAGLRATIDLPDTETGREVQQLVARGDLPGASFAFTVGRQSWRQTPGEEHKPTRVIERVDQLFDVSACTWPAYRATTVWVRSLADPKAARRELVDRRRTLHLANDRWGTLLANSRSDSWREWRTIPTPAKFRNLKRRVRYGCGHPA